MQVPDSVRGLRETLIVRRREANALDADTHSLDAPGHQAQRHVPETLCTAGGGGLPATYATAAFTEPDRGSRPPERKPGCIDAIPYTLTAFAVRCAEARRHMQERRTRALNMERWSA